MVKRTAVFLDRDGVINRKMPEGDYVKSRDEFEFLPGVFEACRILKENGYLCIVVTNQRCISRGIISEATLHTIHDSMSRAISAGGGSLDAVYYCPHNTHENCDCRKPKPGMIHRAVSDFLDRGVSIGLSKSYLVGDSTSDIEAGKAAGLRTVKIGDHSDRADSTKISLLEFVRAIIS